MKSVDDILNEQVNNEEIASDKNKETLKKESVTSYDGKIDVDLTALSSTMVYSEVFNITNSPTDYIGKTIKMNGMFVKYTNQDGSSFYPACVIADAAACCSQGIEFVTANEEYPEEGTDVTVVGIFKSYIDEADGQTYYHLENAAIL